MRVESVSKRWNVYGFDRRLSMPMSALFRRRQLRTTQRRLYDQFGRVAEAGLFRSVQRQRTTVAVPRDRLGERSYGRDRRRSSHRHALYPIRIGHRRTRIGRVHHNHGYLDRGGHLSLS